MRVVFAKMHGLGNDFVLLDNTSGGLALSSAQMRRLADRRFGIGCDQILVAERSARAGIDMRMRIHNADGSEAEQCGNGVRCFALYLRRRGLCAQDSMVIDTRAGPVRAQMEPDRRVTVAMGRPRWEPAEIPFVADARAARYPVRVGPDTHSVGVVSMGNPHAVLVVEDVDAAPVGVLGPRIQALPEFPRGVNVGFMQVLARDHVRLRVYERGAGETLACGSGACAAVAIGRVQQRLGPVVAVDLPGGRLDVSWWGEGESVQMTGPATWVFEGAMEV